MSLAAIYNVWDGEELLPASLAQIRPHVECVILVAQTVSNWGERYEPDLSHATPFADIVTWYEPRPGVLPGINEAWKRNLGLAEARAHGCDWFVSLDCDEFYDGAAFAAAAAAVRDADTDVSACSLETYWRPTWRVEPRESYRVPFVCKLRDATQLGQHAMPWTVDPSRRVGPWASAYVVPPATCVMHHHSWTRRDLRRKLRNSSARINWPARVEEFARAWETWADPMTPLPMPWLRDHRVVPCEDQFRVAEAVPC